MSVYVRVKRADKVRLTLVMDDVGRTSHANRRTNSLQDRKSAAVVSTAAPLAGLRALTIGGGYQGGSEGRGGGGAGPQQHQRRQFGGAEPQQQQLQQYGSAEQQKHQRQQ